MTIQRSVEEIRQAFPEVGITQIINDLDKAQKDFVLETNLLTTLVALTSISTTVKFTLPTDYNRLIELLAYDSTGLPVYLDTLNLAYKVDDTYLYVYSTTPDTIITGMPSTISTLKLNYYNKPNALIAITSTFGVNDEFKGAVEAMVYEKYYSRFKVEVQTRSGDIIKVRDFTATKYWQGKVQEYRIRAKRYVNSKDTRPIEVINYGQAGNYNLQKRPN